MEKVNIYLRKSLVESFCPDKGFSEVTISLMQYLNITALDAMHINVCESETSRGLQINIGESSFLVLSQPSRYDKKNCSINMTVRTSHSCTTYYVLQLSLLDDADASFIRNHFDISLFDDNDNLPF